MVPFNLQMLAIRKKVCKMFSNLCNDKTFEAYPMHSNIFSRSQGFLLYKFDRLIFITECCTMLVTLELLYASFSLQEAMFEITTTFLVDLTLLVAFIHQLAMKLHPSSRFRLFHSL